MNATATSSVLSLLARIRRAARKATHNRDMHYLRANEVRRELAFLNHHTPGQEFWRASLESQRQTIDYEIQAAGATMAEVGETIAEGAHLIDALTTVEQRCDILNVNRTHRTFGGQSPGLLTLTLDLDLEDSALTVGHETKSRPMFQCLMKYIARSAPSYEKAVRLHANDPQGSIFHPDGPYFGVSDYVRNDDGTVNYEPTSRLDRLSTRFNVHLLPPHGTIQ